MFSPKWENREFMEGVWLGLTQYSWAQPYMGAVSVVLDKPLDEILSTSRTLDESVAGGLATLYAKTRARLRVSREEALAEDYTWRVYHFQQCSDFGVFFTSPSHDGVFLRTLEEHEAECVQMFGEKNVLALDSGAVHWDLFDRIPSYQKANHPKLVYVRGGNDPWQVHGPDAPNWTPRVHHDKYDVYDTEWGVFVDVPNGFHMPDRDDTDVALAMFVEAFRLGGFNSND